jgi:hypothetical protein
LRHHLRFPRCTRKSAHFLKYQVITSGFISSLAFQWYKCRPLCALRPNVTCESSGGRRLPLSMMLGKKYT